jgi:hypothetical protein
MEEGTMRPSLAEMNNQLLIYGCMAKIANTNGTLNARQRGQFATQWARTIHRPFVATIKYPTRQKYNKI